MTGWLASCLQKDGVTAVGHQLRRAVLGRCLALPPASSAPVATCPFSLRFYGHLATSHHPGLILNQPSQFVSHCNPTPVLTWAIAASSSPAPSLLQVLSYTPQQSCHLCFWCSLEYPF